MKTFTLDGKRHRIPPELPCWQIERAVSRFHVGTPDAEITTEIRRRAEANGWPKKVITQGELYALKCHRDNQQLFVRYRF